MGRHGNPVGMVHFVTEDFTDCVKTKLYTENIREVSEKLFKYAILRALNLEITQSV
jgi:hypothetical protein